MKKVKLLAVALIIVSLLLTSVGCVVKDSEGQTSNSNKAADTGNKDEKGNEVKQPRKLHVLGPDKSGKVVKFGDREKFPVWEEVQELLDQENLEIKYEIVPFE
jgi:putative aldouronate transport system substrate-binding protein